MADTQALVWPLNLRVFWGVDFFLNYKYSCDVISHMVYWLEGVVIKSDVILCIPWYTKIGVSNMHCQLSVIVENTYNHLKLFQPVTRE